MSGIEDARGAPGWASRAIVAGFTATAMMTLALIVAYYVSLALAGLGLGILSAWAWGLTHNSAVTAGEDFIYLALGLHLLVGLLFALVYGRFFEPDLPGRPWQRGVLFATLPWILSLVVLLPALGGGFLGLGLGAGPLPILGNLVLHLVYGATLGWTYSLGTFWYSSASPADRLSAAASGHSLAVGIVAGLIAGGVLGWLLGVGLGPYVAPGAAPTTLAQVALVGALLGGAVGAIVGPFAGLTGSASR